MSASTNCLIIDNACGMYGMCADDVLWESLLERNGYIFTWKISDTSNRKNSTCVCTLYFKVICLHSLHMYLINVTGFFAGISILV